MASFFAGLSTLIASRLIRFCVGCAVIYNAGRGRRGYARRVMALHGRCYCATRQGICSGIVALWLL